MKKSETVQLLSMLRLRISTSVKPVYRLYGVTSRMLGVFTAKGDSHELTRRANMIQTDACDCSQASDEQKVT